ncbi:flagellar basal body rod protein FlgB [Methylobacterium platani]|uniref:Flagellar biosynthesis protein FlgB n=2 Tax=Methylobacterium platani TaxID=427683 RepID=A0A179S409_9HYPH|nr:flagellar basal body rod protein FlgB [Methylobacterium platani]KMO10960.1 flagellar basal body rod protein FlgB [Methylobacterium platani JCM 14648]OAS20929.1 flagellar biosynthesis protein FlgB [Methylobacterium platani]
MTGVYLFDLASLHGRYLSVRQSTIAGNVANANTQGYQARDTVPFAQVLARTGTEMATTSQAHLGAPGLGVSTRKDTGGWDVLETSSSVSLEQEMLKASDVSRQHNLDVGVVRSFHRMLMSAVRSGS